MFWAALLASKGFRTRLKIASRRGPLSGPVDSQESEEAALPMRSRRNPLRPAPILRASGTGLRASGGQAARPPRRRGPDGFSTARRALGQSREPRAGHTSGRSPTATGTGAGGRCSSTRGARSAWRPWRCSRSRKATSMRASLSANWLSGLASQSRRARSIWRPSPAALTEAIQSRSWGLGFLDLTVSTTSYRESICNLSFAKDV